MVIDKPKKAIVISAINIRAGGPLSILKDCLHAISNSSLIKNYELIALVYSKEICAYENITYYEFPKSDNRFYYFYMEYFGLKKLSKKLDASFWISLSDKSPIVHSASQAVYIHNPTPFFDIKLQDFIYSPFLLFYVLFYKKICAINIRSNHYLIVQQKWLRDSYAKLLNYDANKIIVFPPNAAPTSEPVLEVKPSNNNTQFIFASLPRGFKNFEIIGEAAMLLLKRGLNNFNITLTMKGDESRYAKSVYKKYSILKNISFIGVIPKADLLQLFAQSDCLIFPSRLETWGLPISEFSVYGKPMLLADLPYAHNTASGSKQTAFFNPYDADQLANMMEKIIKNDLSFLNEIPQPEIQPPHTKSWEETINLILNGEN